MRHTAFVLALALAGAAPAAQAATLSYTFQFTNVGNGGGTVTGIIRGIAPSGSSSASSVEVTGNTGTGFAPPGVDPAISQAEYIGTATLNEAFVQDGTLFSFDFVSIGALGVGANSCCSLQIGAVVNGESQVGLTFDPQGNGPNGSFETNITFTLVPNPGPEIDPSPVPLPASGLLAAGALAALAGLGRRRRRAGMGRAGMRRSGLALGLAAALWAPAAGAATLDFAFSFTNTAYGGGTVQGVLRGLATSGASGAASIMVTSNSDPAGFGLGEYNGLPESNAFVVSNGMIVSFNFVATGDANFVYNVNADPPVPTVECCSLSIVGTVGGTTGAGLSNNPHDPSMAADSGISFRPLTTPGPAPVPLPATGLLAAAGLVALARVARRR